MSHENLDNKSGLTGFEIDIIVQKAVRQTFITLGADLSDNKSIQALQRDFAYMRRQRVGGEKIADGVRNAGIISIGGGLLWALWQGIKVAMMAKGAQ